jgi:hypothetical protein
MRSHRLTTLFSILFTTSSIFALSHLLTFAPIHQNNTPTHHAQKPSTSSITNLLPPLPTKAPTTTVTTIHYTTDRSPNDPPYKRTQYRADARPLSWRSFKSAQAASKARSRNHFTLLRAQQQRDAEDYEEEQRRRKWNLGCGLGVGGGSGWAGVPFRGGSGGGWERFGRNSPGSDEKHWDKVLREQREKPNLVVVPPRNPGTRGWWSKFEEEGRGATQMQQQQQQTGPWAVVRPYSTKVVQVAGQAWEKAREVGVGVGVRISAALGSRGGGARHSGWFGEAPPRWPIDIASERGSRGTSRGRSTTRAEIGNPGGGGRRWDGADVV